MTDHWKPDGYPSVSPYLIVDGADDVIDFLERAFDATVVRRLDEPDGTILHAEVRLDDSVVMIGDAGEDWPAIQSTVHVYVPDVDAAYDRALEAGGVPVTEPEQKGGDPDRRANVEGPGGITWSVATRVD